MNQQYAKDMLSLSGHIISLSELTLTTIKKKNCSVIIKYIYFLLLTYSRSCARTDTVHVQSYRNSNFI